MLDPIVGGASEESRNLRLAIAIAIDTEEFISIFANGRGIPAQGPIPPDIFGYKEGKEGIDNYVYEWDGRKPVRKSIEHAKRLLVQAGYPNGRSAKTGEPLVLYFDTVTSGAESKAEFDWLTKKFEALGIQDFFAKVQGSNNPYSMVNATFDALKKMQSPRQVAARRGKKVSDIIVNRETAKTAIAEQTAPVGEEE